MRLTAAVAVVIALVVTGGSAAATSTPACRSARLRLAVIDRGGAAGTELFVVALRNAGERTCRLAGFPGVSLLDGNGHRIGRSARRTHATARTVRLAPGRTASSTLTVLPNLCQGGAPPTSVAVRVYPPGERRPLRARRRVPVCHPQISPLALGTETQHGS